MMPSNHARFLRGMLSGSSCAVTSDWTATLQHALGNYNPSFPSTRVENRAGAPVWHSRARRASKRCLCARCGLVSPSHTCIVFSRHVETARSLGTTVLTLFFLLLDATQFHQEIQPALSAAW